jgi:FAD/FMN-containing dehydrogenase
MNRVLDVDAVNDALTVAAGCVLQHVPEAAAAADRYFPLSLAAEGSCQLGGNLSTNAGGINVLRYGNTRDLVLGLEVVLPDGTIWNGLRALRKDNRGYDMKQIFVGAEGTLGVAASRHARTTSATCSLVAGHATASAAPRNAPRQSATYGSTSPGATRRFAGPTHRPSAPSSALFELDTRLILPEAHHFSLVARGTVALRGVLP